MDPHEERASVVAPVRLPRPRTPVPGLAAQGVSAGRRGKIVVLGRRGLGPALALRGADSGYDVVGLEPEGGFVPWSRAVSAARAEALEHFDVAIIDVPWPPGVAEPDLASVAASADSVARFLLPGATVIVASPTPADTVADAVRLVTHVLESGSRLTAGVDFHLGALTSADDDPTAHRLYGISVTVTGTTDGTSLEIDRFLADLLDETVRPAP